MNSIESGRKVRRSMLNIEGVATSSESGKISMNFTGGFWLRLIAVVGIPTVTIIAGGSYAWARMDSTVSINKQTIVGMEEDIGDNTKMINETAKILANLRGRIGVDE